MSNATTIAYKNRRNKIMKNPIIKFIALSFVGAILVLFSAAESKAQFSKAVVVLKGTVTAEQTGKPHSVRVSVRSAGDTAMEINASRSNSESGYYLVVLKPGKKYWVHLESDNSVAKDILFEAPACDKTQQIVQDFTVTLIGLNNKPDLGDRK